MISELTFDYAHARVAARLAQRPDERLWTQLRSSRSVPALLEAVRASSAASTVSGVPPTGDGLAPPQAQSARAVRSRTPNNVDVL